ncbi:uncharacterized protein TRIREDRAFT_102386 [Trichoderma reesei QM6a]|uniref:Predicted protein n=2 Tax=Hypocrea jecorina TaxID=51453 RepID=G0R8Y7_HYPJQ|nr:uncharacterized protein TRIREDRAFT_102386 [Trichoderma reesei QM6a]EGR52636.1 predicted protein [Trichoderma reesei QM6a]ETS06168.1 hypothetical protein M419DRAFT_125602 [Trichoderma reesei RUT C-30]
MRLWDGKDGCQRSSASRVRGWPGGIERFCETWWWRLIRQRIPDSWMRERALCNTRMHSISVIRQAPETRVEAVLVLVLGEALIVPYFRVVG